MTEKRLNTRIVHKHEVEANWKLSSLIPMKGELIVYDVDENYSYNRIKIGDGVQNVNELPFADANKVDKVAGKELSTNDYTTTEKNKLAGIAEGANKTVVDTAMSATSTNPVQNKVIDAELKRLVGDEVVSDQISAAINSITADSLGVYVQATAPTDAEAGDIWIDTSNDPSFIVPNVPTATEADNGKVLMVVNGTYQLVNLNLSIDANGVVSI